MHIRSLVWVSDVLTIYTCMLSERFYQGASTWSKVSYGMRMQNWNLLTTLKWFLTYEKIPYAICKQQRPKLACVWVQSDEDLLCSVIYSTDANDSVSGKRMPWSACAFAQADQSFRCPHVHSRPFLKSSHSCKWFRVIIRFLTNFKKKLTTCVSEGSDISLFGIKASQVSRAV